MLQFFLTVIKKKISNGHPPLRSYGGCSDALNFFLLLFIIDAQLFSNSF
jgi:hypothetical protein